MKKGASSFKAKLQVHYKLFEYFFGKPTKVYTADNLAFSKQTYF